MAYQRWPLLWPLCALMGVSTLHSAQWVGLSSGDPYSVGETGAACEGGFGLVCFVHRGELPAECACFARRARASRLGARGQGGGRSRPCREKRVFCGRIQGAGTSFFYVLSARFLQFESFFSTT